MPTNKNYGPPTWALTGEELKQANETDAIRQDERCERESFQRFRSVGFRWEPTREMIMTHIVTDVDRHARNEDHIRWLAWASAAEAIAIVVLAILLRLQ